MRKALMLLAVLAVAAIVASTVAVTRSGGAASGPGKAALPGATAGSPAYKTYSGGGTTVEVTEDGILRSFTSPTGYQHEFYEGFHLCGKNPTTGVVSSYYRYDGKFISDSVGLAPGVVFDNAPLTIKTNTVDGKFQVTNVFAFNGTEHRLNINVTVQNISGATINNVIYGRLMDMDVDHDGSLAIGVPSDDVWMSDSRGAVDATTPDSVIGGTGLYTHKMILHAITIPSNMSALYDTVTGNPFSNASCGYSAVDNSGAFTGDGIGLAQNFLGNMPAGTKKTFKIEYLRG